MADDTLPPGFEEVRPTETTDGQDPDGAVRLFDPRTLEGLNVPERRWIVPDWIPDGTVTGAYGDSGIGKSNLFQNLLTCAAAGVPWLGLPTTKCRALGIFCEDPQEEIHRRQDVINRSLGLSFGDLADLRWQSRVGMDTCLMDFDAGGKGRLTELFHELRREAVAFNARLLVLDTVAHLFGGNENVRPQVTKFIAHCLGGLATAIGGAVVFCAHPSQAGLSSGSGTSGSTAWSAGVRSRLYFNTPNAENTDGADDGERVLTRKKSNYAQRGEKVDVVWRDGTFVPKERATGIFAGIKDRERETIFLDALTTLKERRTNVSPSPTANNYAPKAIMTSKLNRGLKVGDLADAMNRLLDAKKLTVESYGRPSDQRHRLAVSGA